MFGILPSFMIQSRQPFRISTPEQVLCHGTNHEHSYRVLLDVVGGFASSFEAIVVLLFSFCWLCRTFEISTHLMQFISFVS